MTTLTQLPTITQRLRSAHPNAKYELNFENPFQLLVATILAAQCTDERVNQVTPGLFQRYPDAFALAAADSAELEELIRPTGFYRQKAKTLRNCSQALVERFGGQVPTAMADLVTLPGVARKTANVVLSMAFHIAAGVIVDTHVARVSQRLGLTASDDPEDIEQELMACVPAGEWIQFGAAMVLHGRYTCTSSEPRCGACGLSDLCPKIGVNVAEVQLMAKKAAKPAGVPKKAAAPSHGTAKSLKAMLPADWRDVLAAEFDKPYFAELESFVANERQSQQVFPPEEDMFSAFHQTPFTDVKVLLLGQDPYHDDGQAHGMCFSVKPGTKPPPSLVNMFKELRDDLGCPIPNNGYLVPWAKQGVLLLNAVLTVRAHQANSHKDQGWEQFTDAVIRALNARPEPVIFMLWGAYAQKKEKLIDGSKHKILTAAHPSPLSVKKFMGSRPYSAVNHALEQLGRTPIDWCLPNL